MTLRAPFPWFGGKSRAAEPIWGAFGPVVNYVEPFAGSLAVLLNRPEPWSGVETVNDADGFIANFWRALQKDADGVARWAYWPQNENDLHARHAWLVEQRTDLTARLEGDPAYCDLKIAGWWVWGICCWIGSGWCSGEGPWRVDESGKLLHVGDAGRGIHRKLLHVGDAGRVSDFARLAEYLGALSARLRRVRVCSGDWTRVVGPSVLEKHGLTGLLLDPPYSADEHEAGYSAGSADIARDVAAWAREQVGRSDVRIVLCGYEGEHDMPGWRVYRWKAKGGYGSQGQGRGRANARRETLWFSPSCEVVSKYPLLEATA